MKSGSKRKDIRGTTFGHADLVGQGVEVDFEFGLGVLDAGVEELFVGERHGGWVDEEVCEIDVGGISVGG